MDTKYCGIATMGFTAFEIDYLAKCLEGGLFGIYSGLFAIHLALHATKRETDGSKPKITFYALCVLYVLTAVVFVIDIQVVPINDVNVNFGIAVTQGTIFGCCDFIAQCILIHRCWIVYGRNIRVIIVPSILALAYLVMWVASNGSFYIVQTEVDENVWGKRLVLSSLAMSMTVNALVTGLIVVKIFKVFRQVSVTNLGEQSLGITRGNKLPSVAFIIIESAMALFAIQLARLVVSGFIVVVTTENNAARYAFEFIVAIHEIVNGITPTIILVRVSLGLSFYDNKSLAEAVGSLQFAATPIPEAGSIDQDWSSHIGHDNDVNPLQVMGNIDQERRDDEVGGSDDIQMVDG